jgi:hypothetical protein
VTPWRERSIEERHLLNPSFCSVVLWSAAAGYVTRRNPAMPLALSFLVLPLVLHRPTRENLPRTTATSFATWLTDQPLARARVAERAVALRPFTQEALLFGGAHQLLVLSADGIRASASIKKTIVRGLAGTSDEVRACAKRADFVGKWFERAGKAETVLALLGVRP